MRGNRVHITSAVQSLSVANSLLSMNYCVFNLFSLPYAYFPFRQRAALYSEFDCLIRAASDAPPLIKRRG